MSIEYKLRHDWYIHASDKEKNLYVSREKPNPSGAFSPCNMSPDDVDYEMGKGKNKKVLVISGMEQKSFEYFKRHIEHKKKILGKITELIKELLVVTNSFRDSTLYTFSQVHEIPNYQNILQIEKVALKFL